jgi:prepilin-type N-terminal cleavage/methylation domain-containing protein
MNQSFSLANKPHNGFTLAELLIVLTILGEISAFTIPKIIYAQQNQANMAKAKEAIGMLSSAYQQVQLSGSVSASTTADTLTPYFNYVVADSSGSLIDDSPGYGSRTCNSGGPCLRLHNGAILQYEAGTSFSGTGTGNALFYFIDPDGVYSGSTNGNNKSVRITVFYNGRISSLGQGSGSICNSSYCLTASSGWDPSWFGW